LGGLAGVWAPTGSVRASSTAAISDRFMAIISLRPVFDY
jgi:hypothetical protein